MSRLSGIREIELLAHEDPNLDTVCYRGSGPLAHLALASQADVYDQVANPDGLQRDLSPKHASEAYDYVREPRDPAEPRAFPEVVLNVRDKRAVEIERIDSPDPEVRLVRLRFNLDRTRRDDKVSVSRVDGNHRLYYAAGDDRREPLLENAPFQIHIGLTPDQERSLFVDINSNQKGLNTSHLAVMQAKLTEEEREIRDHLDRWVTTRLSEDPQSPWHGLIHHGGSKKGSRAQGLTRLVNFASLQSGVSRTLAKSQYIHDLTDPHAQYIIVRNYWEAVRRTFADEWASPRDYLLLKNIGVMSLSILAGAVIDRCLARGKAGVSDMGFYLVQCRNRFDWRRNVTGDRSVAGMSGNRAALIIGGEMAAEMSDEQGLNTVRELQAQLVAADTQ